MKKPETLQGQYAGFMSRFFAFVIDVIVIIIILVALTLAWRFVQLIPQPFANLFVSNHETAQTIQFVFQRIIIPTLVAFVIVGYFVFFWMSTGQTLGKALMGVRVVSVTGRPLTFFQAFFRFLMYAISLMVFFLGFIWILIDNQRQGWHDTLARTYVIYSWKAVPHAGFLRQWQKKKPH